MDILSLLISINKISLIIFFVTLGFLGYEIYLLMREKKQRKNPVIPNFDTTIQRKSQEVGFTKSEKKINFTKSNNILIIILIAILIIVGVISVVGVLKYDTTDIADKNVQTEQVQTLNSKGILFFNKDFQSIDEDNLRMLKIGDTIIVGLDKTRDPDIDMARFLVNSQDWKDAVITDSYNVAHNIYYISYTVASSEAQLYFQAQLHSKKDGWLGN